MLPAAQLKRAPEYKKSNSRQPKADGTSAGASVPVVASAGSDATSRYSRSAA
jgi:hypothetical protein